MDNLPTDVLQDEAWLEGRSSTNPRNWVLLDIEKDAAGRFHIVEQRPTFDARWGDYPSGVKALEVLKNYIETHPIYSDYAFHIESIDPQDVISVTAEKSNTQLNNARPTEPNIKNEDRSNVAKSDNNRPEKLQENISGISGNDDHNQRAQNTTPATEDDKSKSVGDQAEEAVSQFFGQGQQAAATLKGQLEEYVNEGGNPMLAALGATGLDALNLAMGFAGSTATGILDVRNLGEGVKKGSWEGVKEDLGRVVNVLPQGKAVKVISAVLTASDLVDAAGTMVDAANKGDAKTVLTTAGSVAASLLIKKLTSRKGKNVKMDAHFPDGPKKVEVPKKVLKEAAKRSAQLNAYLDGASKKFNTVAVFVAYDPRTKKAYIPISANKSLVPKKFRDWLESDEHLRGIDKIKGLDKNNLHHAEVNGITGIWSNGDAVLLVMPSNNACPVCLAMLNSWRIPFINPKDLKAFTASLQSGG
ncbi:hypothetical protein [Noviherbaspirillum massiliense]|uniref:hypothetical protein n=1 Tax=Noviherbaspirillum massiliense TaxID=1465823 RepID=UPI00030972DE|nr:hypothetical protein [Noviherbaspirillum massiliense]